MPEIKVEVTQLGSELVVEGTKAVNEKNLLGKKFSLKHIKVDSLIDTHLQNL